MYRAARQVQEGATWPGNETGVGSRAISWGRGMQASCAGDSTPATPRPPLAWMGPGPSPNGGLARQDEVGQWLGWGAAAPTSVGHCPQRGGALRGSLAWPGEGARERCPQGWAASGSAVAGPLRAQQASLRLAAGPDEASAVGARGVVQGLVGAVAPDGLQVEQPGAVDTPVSAAAQGSRCWAAGGTSAALHPSHGSQHKQAAADRHACWDHSTALAITLPS